MERGMIPMTILSKMGKYRVNFKSQSVKVEVLDSAELINSWIIDHLKPKLQGEEPVIVGLDLHASKNIWGDCSTNSLLVICINDANCLVVQRKYVDKKPEILKKFLGDRKICFMGVGLDRKLSRGVPPSPDLLLCQKAELSHLVARIHKKPSYCNSDLKALAAMYKVPYEPPASGGCYGCGRINYEARVFSEEEVKALVHDAYVCYKIGQKLVEMLYRNDTTGGTIRGRRNCSAMKQLWEQFRKCWNPPGHGEHSEGNNSRNAGNNSGDPLPDHETTQGTTQGMQELPGHETTQETQEPTGHETTRGTTQETQEPPGHEITQETQEPPGHEIIQETQELPGHEIIQETQEPPDHETTQRTTQETQEPPGHEITQEMQEPQEPPGHEIIQETQEPPDHETTQRTTQETQEPPGHEITQEMQEPQEPPGHEIILETQEPPDHETTQRTTQETQEPPDHETTQRTTQETQEPPAHETTQRTTQETQEPPGHEITQETQEPHDHETTQRTTQETQEPSGHETILGTQ